MGAKALNAGGGPAPVRDPRGIVTPDAFAIDDSLLGLPLARPGRRLAALAIDGVVIGVLIAVTKSFSLVLGVVVATLFIRASMRRTEVPNSVFGRAMRLSLGCLGLFIGLLTAVAWGVFGLATFSGDDGPTDPVVIEGSGVELSGPEGVGAAMRAMGGGLALRRAETPAAASREMARMAQALLGAGTRPDDVVGVLAAAAPDDAPWTNEAEALARRVVDSLAALRSPEVGGARLASGDSSRAGIAADGAGADAVDDEDGDGPGVDPGTPADPATLTLSEAVTQLQALRADSLLTPSARAERVRALEVRVLSDVAGDTLQRLESSAQQARELADRRERERDDLEARLDAKRGFVAWVRDWLDELGFGFGWASLYMTVVLSAWKGQTVGKKILGIRVVRLDGQPITWWTAFERVGGYAAGLATGLLGFAQVYWDANRQCIHDHIVGTVVVVDGGEPMGPREEVQ